jgi:predicted polyphosphate/ATP-dependent NAD kinase
MLDLGLIVNPISGIGGEAGLKGSDGEDVQHRARERGGSPRGAQRTAATLQALGELAAEFNWLTWAGPMGEDVCRPYVQCQVLGGSANPSTAQDTMMAAQALVDAGVDLLVFAGGDGTARDIYTAVGSAVPVLGIPCGVKMNSGVFATSPSSAAVVLRRIHQGGLVRCVDAEVRDLDETALRQGEVVARFYGEMRVPEVGGYMQHTKERGRESEPLAIGEIVAYVAELVSEIKAPVILGPGGTLKQIKDALGVPGTLLGVDVLVEPGQFELDVSGLWLEQHVRADWHLILSFAAGQGIVFGRGNQQLTPEVLIRLDQTNVHLVATRTKLNTLEGRPLLVDTGNAALDARLAGLTEIIAGYQDTLFYRLEWDAGDPAGDAR